jgi:hypothetical protein
MPYTETPMREQFKIDDPQLVQLIKKILDTADQYWDDVYAFEIAKLITDYVQSKEAEKTL